MNPMQVGLVILDQGDWSSVHKFVDVAMWTQICALSENGVAPWSLTEVVTWLTTPGAAIDVSLEVQHPRQGNVLYELFVQEGVAVPVPWQNQPVQLLGVITLAN